MYRIGIIGDGYTAAELLRLMLVHRVFNPVYISSTENIGTRVDELYPQLYGRSDLACEPTEIEVIKQKCDAVFLALPHGLSVPMVKQLTAAGIKCVDLGADFRLKDAEIYKKYYGLTHEAPEMLVDAVYGIPELYRDKIKSCDVVANPGCFPTSAILPMAPLLRKGLIEPTGIIVDSKSGVSGAGRTPKDSNNFCNVNESIKAYGVGNHRHTPEIAQELSFAAGEKVQMLFTPHLVPMNRGILSTIYSHLRPGVAREDVRAALEAQYNKEYFVNILPEGTFPQTKSVYGSNFVQIGVHTDEEGNVILVSAIDNLCKGASGQAIQNMNLMLGVEETEGLTFAGVNP